MRAGLAGQDSVFQRGGRTVGNGNGNGTSASSIKVKVLAGRTAGYHLVGTGCSVRVDGCRWQLRNDGQAKKASSMLAMQCGQESSRQAQELQNGAMAGSRRGGAGPKALRRRVLMCVPTRLPHHGRGDAAQRRRVKKRNRP